MPFEKTYPVKDTRTVADPDVELTFSVFVRYGSEDRSEWGERLVGVVDRAGTSHRVSVDARHWQEVCPSVHVNTNYLEAHAGGEENPESTVTCIRVERSACPMLLLAEHFMRYTSEHYDDFSSVPYAIRLVAPSIVWKCWRYCSQVFSSFMAFRARNK